MTELFLGSLLVAWLQESKKKSSQEKVQHITVPNWQIVIF